MRTCDVYHGCVSGVGQPLRGAATSSARVDCSSSTAAPLERERHTPACLSTPVLTFRVCGPSRAFLRWPPIARTDPRGVVCHSLGSRCGLCGVVAGLPGYDC